MVKIPFSENYKQALGDRGRSEAEIRLMEGHAFNPDQPKVKSLSGKELVQERQGRDGQGLVKQD